MANNTKTILCVTSVALVIVVLIGAGYSVVDSTAKTDIKIDTSITLHDTAPDSHIHLRHAVTAVSEATGAIQDSLLSMRFQLQSIKEILEEIRDDGN